MHWGGEDNFCTALKATHKGLFLRNYFICHRLNYSYLAKHKRNILWCWTCSVETCYCETADGCFLVPIWLSLLPWANANRFRRVGTNNQVPRYRFHKLIWQNFVFQANVVDFDLHVSQGKWQICFLLAKGSPLPFQVCKIFPLTIECAKRDLLDNKICMILYRTKFPDASPPNNKSPSPPSPSRNEWLERDTWRARDNHDWSNMRTQSILLYLVINHYMNYAKEPTMGKEGNK